MGNGVDFVSALVHRDVIRFLRQDTSLKRTWASVLRHHRFCKSNEKTGRNEPRSQA
jgi:hypothetical protein